MLKIILSILAMSLGGCVTLTPDELVARDPLGIYECDVPQEQAMSYVARGSENTYGSIEYIDPHLNRAVISFKNIYGARVLLIVAQVSEIPGGSRVTVWSEPKYSIKGSHADVLWEGMREKLDKQGIPNRVVLGDPDDPT